jgi:hypothetical protein
MEFIIESGRVDLPERPIPPEIVIFYITQDTQRHPLLPDIKTGLFFQHFHSSFGDIIS